MKKPVANLSASVRQRLLNLATERKEDFGLLLTRYGLERFLYRLSISPHRNGFVLKGALLLQLWTAEIYRPTRDLDLLGRVLSDINFRTVFKEVCSQNAEDDGLTFLPGTIRVERIRDDEAYEGVRVRVEARLGMRAFLFRSTSVSATRLFPHQRNWNTPRSLNFLHPNCTSIPRRVWLRKSSKPWSNSASRIAE